MSALPLPQSWVEWHAALTHFPITLLFVSMFFDIVALFWNKPRLRETSLWLLALAVISLPFSLASGYYTGLTYKRAPAGFDSHWQAAAITSVLALLLLIWRLAAKDKLPRVARVIVLTLTAACSMGIGYTGHQGGEMTFGSRTEEDPEVASAPKPDSDINAQRIDISAEKMRLAAERMNLAAERLALAKGGKVPAQPPIVVNPPSINAVTPDAMEAAAQKFNDVALRFEQAAAKLEKAVQDMKDITPSVGTPPTPAVVTPGATKTPAAGTPQAPKNELDPKLIAAGEKIYFAEDNGCVDCHKMNGKGGKKGPDLTKAGLLHGDIEWQIGHMKDPAKYVPGSKMPAYDDMSDEDLRALAVFLVSKK